MGSKKTVVVGATTNPSRYAFLAAQQLVNNGHGIVLLGIKQGEVAGQPILNIASHPEISEVDTLTIYVSAHNLGPYHDYLVSLRPKRIICNPGAENPKLDALARKKGIQTEHACTLVLLSTGQY